VAVLAFFVFFKSFGLDLKTRSSVQAFLLTHGTSFRNSQKTIICTKKNLPFYVVVLSLFPCNLLMFNLIIKL